MVVERNIEELKPIFGGRRMEEGTWNVVVERNIEELKPILEEGERKKQEGEWRKERGTWWLSATSRRRNQFLEK